MARISIIRVAILSGIVLLGLVRTHGQTPPNLRRQAQKRSVPQPKPAIVPIAIVAFRQTVGQSETEALGLGITDSLANALKSFGSLAVAGPEVVSAASKDLDPAKKDDDAIQLANQIGVVMIIVGTYQHIGGQLIIDARILNAQTGAALPGSAISLNETFPQQYSTLLTQLTTRVTSALRLPTTAAQTQKLSSSFMSSSSSDALRFYNQGLKRLGEGTVRSLEEAVNLFTECLNADPAYALAYAARAEAENRLVEAKQASGENTDNLTQAALRDAQEAVRSRPNAAHGQRALAKAYSASGEYDKAIQSAQRAITLSPNDGAAQMIRARAQNRGELVGSREINDLMFKQPWIQYMFFYMPKVIVRNQSSFDLRVSFSPASGDGYPPLVVKPQSSRAMTVFPGKFGVDLDSDAGILKREYEFKQGDQYELTYRAEEIPLTRVIGTNSGNSPAYVTFEGPKKREHVINPGDQSVFNVQSGQYTITCAGASGGGSLQQRQEYLRAGGEYRYNCNVRSILRYGPAEPQRKKP